MRYCYFSDPHCNADPTWFPHIQESVDLILCAGDIHIDFYQSVLFLQRLHDVYRVPVIAVLGNHDYEAYSIQHIHAAIRHHNQQHTGVTILENDSFIYGDTTIFGATLWSNFGLYGEQERYFAEQAAKNLGDFHHIQYDNGALTPHKVRELCHVSTEWLHQAIQTSSSAHKILLTHFSPHPAAIAPEYGTQAVNAYFANNLPQLYGYVDTVIHGHTHHSMDFVLPHGTRVLCNARGHRHHRLNPHFTLPIIDTSESPMLNHAIIHP